MQPTAATFRHCVMKGDWTGAVNGKIKWSEDVGIVYGKVHPEGELAPSSFGAKLRDVQQEHLGAIVQLDLS